jgi:hypothetical protein
VDAGGELTVDHYRPTSAGINEIDENLVYACIRCNQFKGDFFPNTDDLERGRRILHPLNDDIFNHMRENLQMGHVEALSETGHFHIFLLQLNRPALVEHRLRRRLALLLEEKHKLLEEEIVQLRKTIDAQEIYIQGLRRLLGIELKDG